MSESTAAWTPGPAWLFCPADRPDRYAKAAERSDVAIIDLEDAVAPQDKPAAREALAAAYGGLDPERTLVRINPAATADHALDVDLVQAAKRKMAINAQKYPAEIARGSSRKYTEL